MPRIQRFAHSIQRLTYVNFFKPEPREVRPDDVYSSTPTDSVSPSYAAWNATSFSGFVPFSSPPGR
ncbi:MAG TPA: hypothetical protein VMF52_02310 [Steroidobacteraceae bacterium]|nr:hypothetical protein [Steroidobacteraceae bacterium]